MGGGVASLMGSAFPAQIAGVACIELFGTLSAPAAGSAKHLRRGLRERLKMVQRINEGKIKAYDSFDACVDARRRTVEAAPGKQSLSYGAAARLVERGAVETEEGWVFRHDPRLNAASASYVTEPQVLALLEAIECPVLAIRADPEEGRGWPMPPDMAAGRIAATTDMTMRCLPGSHHLHLDEDTAPAVTDATLEFFGGLDAEAWAEVELPRDRWL
mmetsp:Transcript_42644/g.133684  ORF Transcript_42644/g.133684 Transcript_42644/m.133684 type:complete len:216 (-) Transcript_42644:375-1022(-)